MKFVRSGYVIRTADALRSCSITFDVCRTGYLYKGYQFAIYYLIATAYKCLSDDAYLVVKNTQIHDFSHVACLPPLRQSCHVAVLRKTLRLTLFKVAGRSVVHKAQTIN